MHDCEGVAAHGRTGARLRMGKALRERANALRYLGKFNDALRALEYAERFFDTSPGADDFDLAIVWYIRAIVFAESGRLAEGIERARACRKLDREDPRRSCEQAFDTTRLVESAVVGRVHAGDSQVAYRKRRATTTYTKTPTTHQATLLRLHIGP